jgi:hypothetical protein
MPRRRHPRRRNNKLSWLANVVSSAETAPAHQSAALYAELAGQIDAELATLKEVTDEDLKALNELAAKPNVPAGRGGEVAAGTDITTGRKGGHVSGRIHRVLTSPRGRHR